MIYGSAQNDVVIHDSGDFTETRLVGHTDQVLTLKLINDSLLASGGADNRILFWNLTTMSEIQRVNWHSSSVTALDSFIGIIVLCLVLCGYI